MKIVDGKDLPLGRLASYVAKEALKGEEIAVINCEEVIITGSRKDIEERLKARRKRVGSGQQGPKVPMTRQMIVKRAIRGMLPNHRMGRGKQAFQRIKCYIGIPKQFEKEKKINLEIEKKKKFIYVKEISR